MKSGLIYIFIGFVIALMISNPFHHKVRYVVIKQPTKIPDGFMVIERDKFNAIYDSLHSMSDSTKKLLRKYKAQISLITRLRIR